MTQEFFARHAQKCEFLASEIVILEIERDPDASHRQTLLEALRRHPITMLTGGPEIERLAGLYLARGVIPARKREDALHVAYATVHGMDILLSWNFKHLANVSAAKPCGKSCARPMKLPLRMASSRSSRPRWRKRRRRTAGSRSRNGRMPMPEISRFYGIGTGMFYDAHRPPEYGAKKK